LPFVCFKKVSCDYLLNYVCYDLQIRINELRNVASSLVLI
jgi:hypothetical protein